MSLQDHMTVPNLPLRPSEASPHTGMEALPSRISRAVTHVKRYEQTFVATQPRAYRALVRAVQLLRYAGAVNDPEAVQVGFKLYGRAITAKVLSESPGRSKVVVEVTRTRASGTGATPLFAQPALMAGRASLRGMEQRFAVMFLDNVGRVLEGRAVVEDSSLPSGIERRQSRGREV